MAKEKEDWRPEYDEMKDILRPIEKPEESPAQASAPPPKGNAPTHAQTFKQKFTEAEREWQAKRAEEERQRRRSDAKAQRLMFALPIRREARPEGQEKRRENAVLGAWPHIASLVVPCATLLLLAPFIHGTGEFYLLALLTGAPVALAAALLRPPEKQGWLLWAVAPLLPVEAHFTLQYFRWSPGGALMSVGLCALAGVLGCIIALRVKEGGKEVKEAGRLRSHRILLFAALLAAFSLLIPAALGLGLQLYRPNPDGLTTLEADSLRDDALMTRRMNGAYERLQDDKWAQANRQKRLEALQALLNAETDAMGIDRFDLRDPMVLATVSGTGHTSVPAALLSGKSGAEERVRSMLHLAYHLKQLTLSRDVDLRRFEAAAKGYEDNRYAEYVAKWANREVENDHAG